MLFYHTRAGITTRSSRCSGYFIATESQIILFINGEFSAQISEWVAFMFTPAWLASLLRLAIT
jgi:hypothetical protein